MGMDVFGRMPTAEEGQYFRANVWMWRPIHDLIEALCGDLINECLLCGMAFNQGAGPFDAETCRTMADRLDAWLTEHPDGHALDCDRLCARKSDRLIVACELALCPEPLTESPYRVGREEISEFIRFLRHCGGFAVW
jgi:hypothetical protein